ncbi:uncharacterized protein LOC130960122 [Arachis stenosperma]|uniref:uncharacterized protein LOC130960119 n=1 Tax=Arachis stenosperma TaxID=217475 RepID=UPI0025ACD599|nr:uncharacterized protein LOC130960119 [Arachis stenosperma]XP_057741425.1 uncharacterized protein LOC130960122 [Arachis stenosperma]QHN95472.1 fasciclin-like arabinogalactan protein [Arachis hypogaea]
MVVIHGLQAFIAPFSCDVERMTSLSFPFHPDHRSGQHINTSGSVQPAIMRLMLRDAMLRNNGFSILALPRKVKYAELVTLNNMTVFAVDDLSIFSGSHSYISNVRFHIVPNQTISCGSRIWRSFRRGLFCRHWNEANRCLSQPPVPMRIKVPDVIRNVKIVVHSVYLPFPHILILWLRLTTVS